MDDIDAVEQRAAKMTNQTSGDVGFPLPLLHLCRSPQVPESIFHLIPADFAGAATLTIGGMQSEQS